MANEEQLELYKAALKKAWEDGVITPHEHQIIENLRLSMGITDDMHEILESEVKGETKTRPGLDAYKAALEQAWIDKVITKDERAILERLKNVLQITDDEQRIIETEIREKLFTNKSEGCVPTQTRSAVPHITPSSPPPVEPPVLQPTMQSKQAIKVRKPAAKLPVQPPAQPPAQQPAKPPAQLPEQPPIQQPEQTESIVPKEDAAFWLNQGETIFTSSNGDNEKIEKAIDYFNKAIELEPLNFLAWSNKGLGLKILNRFDDALMCYERALILEPDHINSWFNKAVLLGCMSRYSDAAECYRKVLEMEPSHELARRDLNIIDQVISGETAAQ
jgi:tetratricopeptide (TPR) repeat protein